MAIKSKVLFLCSENTCRTQMAEAFLRDLAGDRFDVVTAGNEPGRVDQEAIAAMLEVGIDISGQVAKSVTPYLGERFTYVIALCDRQQERTCPIFPGAIWRMQWNIENPAATQNHDSAVRRARDQIKEHVLRFVTEQQ